MPAILPTAWMPYSSGSVSLRTLSNRYQGDSATLLPLFINGRHHTGAKAIISPTISPSPSLLLLLSVAIYLYACVSHYIVPSITNH